MGSKIFWKGKICSLLMVVSLLIGALVLFAPASAETEPTNNNRTGADTITPPTGFNGHVNDTDGDPSDWWKFDLAMADGATNTDKIKLPMAITDMNKIAPVNIHTPDDNGWSFVALNYYGISNGTHTIELNATMAGTYYLEFPYGDVTYDCANPTITQGANPGFDDDNTFATAANLSYGHNSGTATFPDEQDYVDFFKFTVNEGDHVDINLTNYDMMREYETFLINGSSGTYEDLSSSDLVEVTFDYWRIYFTAEYTCTYYLAIACPSWGDGASGSVDWDAKVIPKPPNRPPDLDMISVIPGTIDDNRDSKVTLSINALDPDGDVDHVTVNCSALWTGDWTLPKGFGDKYSGQFVIEDDNVSETEVGTHQVHFKAYDDEMLVNETTFDLNVVLGNRAPESTYTLASPYAITLDEDQEKSCFNISTLVTDDAPETLEFQLDNNGWGSSYYGEYFRVEFLNESWICIEPIQDENGVDTFDVNCSDGEEWIYFSIEVTINPTNDAPVWDSIQRMEPTGNKYSLDFGEVREIALDEDVSYRFVLSAEDIDGDTLSFGSNITMDGFEVKADGNVTFTPTQEDIGIGNKFLDLSVEFQVFDVSLTEPGNTTIVLFNISNVNDAPTEPGFKVTVQEKNLTQKFTVTAPTDEDGDTEFTYEFDFDGDGKKDMNYGPTEEATFDIEFTYLSAGDYTPAVTVKDAEEGANTTTLAEITITAPDDDPSGPTSSTIVLTGPAPNAQFEPGKQITVTGTSIGIDEGTEVTVTLENTTEKSTIGTDGSFSLDITVPTDPGTYSLKAEAGGKSSSVSIVVTGDAPVTDDDDDDTEMNYTPFIISGVISLVLIIIIVVLLVVFMMLKKKRSEPESELPPPDAANAEPEVQYDEFGQPIQQNDPNTMYGDQAPPAQDAGQVQYDEYGQPIQPDAGQVQYDENGQPVQQAAPQMDQPAMDQPPAQPMVDPAQQPVMEQPGMAQPAMDQPGMAQPGQADPGAAQQPGTEYPGQ